MLTGSEEERCLQLEASGGRYAEKQKWGSCLESVLKDSHRNR